MGRPSLIDDPIIKVTFEDCEKREVYVRKSFRSEWDSLVNKLKKKYGEIDRMDRRGTSSNSKN